MTTAALTKQLKKVTADMNPAAKGKYAANFVSNLSQKVASGELSETEATKAYENFFKSELGTMRPDQYITFLEYREQTMNRILAKELLQKNAEVLDWKIKYMELAVGVGGLRCEDLEDVGLTAELTLEAKRALSKLIAEREEMYQHPAWKQVVGQAAQKPVG